MFGNGSLIHLFNMEDKVPQNANNANKTSTKSRSSNNMNNTSLKSYGIRALANNIGSKPKERKSSSGGLYNQAYQCDEEDLSSKLVLNSGNCSSNNDKNEQQQRPSAKLTDIRVSQNAINIDSTTLLNL